MVKRTPKESLFDDFYSVARLTFEALELRYDVTGVVAQVFGDPNEDKAESKRRLRESHTWRVLSDLYDYAVDGVEPEEEPENVVTDAADIITLATSDNHRPSEAWYEIVSMADGRVSLDYSMSVQLHKVALLAGVDVRTVRNAVSAGDLTAVKHGKAIEVEYSSARSWLHGRKGYRPTVHRNEQDLGDLAAVKTPAEFGAFLTARRKHLSLGESAFPRVQGASPEAVRKLEEGMFPLPLDAAFPVADFYQISRKNFLETVMRVFFLEEFSVLRDVQTGEGQTGPVV